ncbi:unnamed protein product [Schistosoma rodhaini]|nr:unnamed protein product [Schistosoma rodhaini]
MTGYKRAKLGQLNRLVTLKNKVTTHKRNICDAAFKPISDIHFAKKLESLLGQATCTSYPDHQIKSILCSLDVIKNNYLHNGRLRKEACEASDALFYRAGADVTIVARDLKKLQSARETIKCGTDRNNNVFVLSVDLTSEYSVLNEILSKHVATLGSVDILVNCAGYAVARKFLDTPTDDIQGMLHLNYLSAVHVTKILLPYMLDQKVHQTEERRIAFICSLASQVGVYGYAAYTGSKYALRGFAETLDMELGHKGPFVTIAFPPDTDTPGYIHENVGKPVATKAISATAGLASPDDVAKSVYLDITNGKLISTCGLEGVFLSWITAGIFPPVSVRCRYLSDFIPGIIFACVEILAATPLRAVGIVYAFWMRYISFKYNE